MKQEFIDYCMEQLKINACFIDFDATPDSEWGQDHAEAYCGEGDSFGPLRVFEIEYKESLENDRESFYKMIAHELVHVMQALRGDVFDYSLPYHAQPHEVEAYAKQEELYEGFFAAH